MSVGVVTYDALILQNFMNYDLIPEFETASYLHAVAVVKFLSMNTVFHNLFIISSFYSAQRKHSFTFLQIGGFPQCDF